MTSTDAPEVVVTDLRASYDRRVLTSVTFTAPAGATTIVSGAAGSGKTSLVRVLLGRMVPESGTVTIGGRSVVGASTGDLADLHHRTRFLFSGLSAGAQGRKGSASKHLEDPDDGVTPKATVADNLRSAIGGAGADADRVRRFLETFDLTADEHRPASELGPGARRRLALARVFVTDPLLVVLDDPVAALDPAERDAVVAALCRVRAESGATIVLTCYDIATAKGVGDHLVVLVAGRVRREGRADRLLRLIDSDAQYAAQYAMGGMSAGSSSDSLVEHRKLGRFHRYDQGVLLGLVTVIGLFCLVIILASIWWRYG